MCIGFSYMSFVIKHKLEKRFEAESLANHFDIVPYNYIFNRSTAFLDSEFVADNHLILEEVLRNCWNTDPDVID